MRALDEDILFRMGSPLYPEATILVNSLDLVKALESPNRAFFGGGGGEAICTP